MMPMLLGIILALIFPWSYSWADTHTAASCSDTDITTQLEAATAGDIISIPPCDETTWTNRLCYGSNAGVCSTADGAGGDLVRGVTLQGSGIDVTNIKGKIELLIFAPNSTAAAAHDTLKITGMTINGDNGETADFSQRGLITISPANDIIDYVTLIATGNKFKNTQGSGTVFWIKANVYGVIHKNTFDRIARLILTASVGSGSGGGYATGYQAWNTLSQTYGTVNTLYIEDNHITFSSDMVSGDGHNAGFVENGGGGRHIFRYNTWDMTNATITNSYWDDHGLQTPDPPGGITGCTSYSQMTAEFYGNKIYNDAGAAAGSWMAHRGGWLLMFNNYYNASVRVLDSVNGGIGMQQYFCDACQTVGSFTQEISNTYIWNNRAFGASGTNVDIGGSIVATSPGCPGDPPVKDTNFFNYNASFDAGGTTCGGTPANCLGVGCGAATPSGTCTTGSAYWKTLQDCADMTTMVGAKGIGGLTRAEDIAGSLYKCVDAAWVADYYTPYRYPHPLRGPFAPTVYVY